jgi:long-chain acyl-CoA synthetase
MEYILNHSEAKVLLVGEDFLPQLAQMQLELDRIVVLGDPGDSGYPTYAQWIAGQPANDPNHPAAPEDTCYQLYTSGTTGLPKGVETTHANLIYMMTRGLGPLEMNTSSVNLVCMPLFHISGSGWGVLGLHRGATSILLHDVDLQEILRVIPHHRVTHSVFVPAVLQFLLAQPNVNEMDYSSLRVIAYGASPIAEDVLVSAMKTFRSDFFQLYGLTETTGGITRLDPTDHDPGGPRTGLLRSCGRLVEGHEIRIMDSSNHEAGHEVRHEVGKGEVGEIWIRGPQVMKGYWRNPKATAESIDKDGWFRSGDVGYVIDGYLYIHDRLKDMIISGGENIYPAEIENVLMRHDRINDAAIIGVPDQRWGETVRAFITRKDAALTEEDVISFCRQHLAGYKCPTSVEWMDAIPRNPSGKILKTELRKPWWDGRGRNVS